VEQCSSGWLGCAAVHKITMSTLSLTNEHEETNNAKRNNPRLSNYPENGSTDRLTYLVAAAVEQRQGKH